VTDGQLAALIAAITSFCGGLFATIKWAVGRIVKALDDNSAAHLKSAEQLAVLSTKIDYVYQNSERTSGVHDVPVEYREPRETRPRAKSNPSFPATGGEYLVTSRSRGGGG
jgi:hypothetical protein